MKKLSLIILLAAGSASCQDFGKLEIVDDLPGRMNEVSGIEKFANEEVIWMINDSGNLSEVYVFNLQNKKIEQTIRVPNAKNTDWEDLATNSNGTLYIGDFGNNDSKREELTIYHFKDSTDLAGKIVKPETTVFRYEDQEEFPPEKKNISFDAEAFIFLKGHFYIFTRNRAKKYDGTTRIYKLPALPGNHTAKYVGSIKTCDKQKDCEITSATIHHPSGKIALLSSEKVWIIDQYEGDDFNSGEIKQIELDYHSQKESICFKSENELYIADEKDKGKGRNLYLFKLD